MKQHTLLVRDLDVSELRQHPENANNGDLEALEDSIAQNGFYAPIIVQDSTGYVIAGNHRLLAAMRAGMKTIPGIVLELTDEEAKRIMVADNRITRLGFDDEGQLANLLEDLHDTNAGLSGTGYDYDAYEKLMALVHEPLTASDLGVDDGSSEPDQGSSSSTPRLNFSIMPVISEDGKVYEMTISRSNYTHITANDLQLLRKALGQERLSREEMRTWGVPDWDRSL
jgi:hypothetical protein